jgi:uncharacterized protein (TIGR02996 family)
MSDELALLTAIIANPDEDTPRLMFADWLQENGQPERAEFIRVQIEITPLPDRHTRPLHDRAPDNARITRFRELFAAHQEEWLRPLGVKIPRATFRRGFVEELCVTPDELLKIGDAILCREMLSSIEVVPPPDDTEDVREDPPGDMVLRRLASWPGRGRLRALRVAGMPLTSGAVGAFLASPPVCGLRSLDIGSCTFGAPVVRAVSASANLPELTELRLGSRALSADDVFALARAPHLKKLRTLSLSVTGENEPDAPEALHDACRELRARYPHLRRA